VAVHPGVVLTEADRHLPLPWAVKELIKLVVRPWVKSIPQGAATTVGRGRLAVYPCSGADEACGWPLASPASSGADS
jgi:hypothetical protein